MFLSDKQLARIPIAPRAKAMRPLTKPVVFLVAKDPAVMAIARMVIAGLDKKYHIHPDYRALLKIYGKEKTRELIEGACKEQLPFHFLRMDGWLLLVAVRVYDQARSSRYRFRQKTDYRLQSKKVSR